jgi:hypothetical protein
MRVQNEERFAIVSTMSRVEATKVLNVKYDQGWKMIGFGTRELDLVMVFERVDTQKREGVWLKLKRKTMRQPANTDRCSSCDQSMHDNGDVCGHACARLKAAEERISMLEQRNTIASFKEELKRTPWYKRSLRKSIKFLIKDMVRQTQGNKW